MKIGIGQIILEESSFKHREDYLSLEPTTQQDSSEVTLNITVQRTSDSLFVVRLSVVNKEGALYQFTVSYALFGQMNPEPDQSLPDDIDRRLLITGGFMLYPFIRECVANLTNRGRFGPTWLGGADFNELVPENVASNRQ